MKATRDLLWAWVHFWNFKISNQYDANVVFIVIFNVRP